MTEQSLKEKTAKGLFWGGLSNGLQQLLNLIFGIFLARMLSPTDYGMVGMLTIFSAIANNIQESGFIAALTNKKVVTQKDYNAVFWFSNLCGFFLYLLLFFLAPFIAQFYKAPELTALARFSFLGPLLASFGIVPSAILFKNMRVKESAKSSILGIFIAGIAGIIMAANGFTYWGIAAQSILFIIVNSGMKWYYAAWKPNLKWDFKPLKALYGFSIMLLLTNIFNQINANIISVLLGKFYSIQQVGFYTQANKWTTMGYSTINGMIANVSQPVFAKVLDEQEKQTKIFRKMLRFTALITFPAMLGLALVAKELILISVTDKWLACVPMMQLLCIWGAVIPINNLYANMIISQGKSTIYMYSTVSLGIIQLLILFFTLSYGIYNMIIGFVTINILWIFVWHRLAQPFIRFSYCDMLKDLLPFALLALGTIYITYFITLSIQHTYISFFMKFIVAAILYIITLWLTKAIIFKESVSFLLKFIHRK